LATKIPPENIELATLDRGPSLSHEIEVKMEIVQSQQTQTEDCLSLDQVAQVTATEFAAGGQGSLLRLGLFGRQTRHS